MAIIWFLAVGAGTLYLLQQIQNWQKSKEIKLPWYTWLLGTFSYLTIFVAVPSVYTLAGEAQKQPALFTALIFTIIFVVLAALTRQSLVYFTKTKG